ncbi:MAG: PHP domain-containing protein [Sphaerochaetaceae bacterium]|jgi:PHP family Zn ribbon phosphoesterase
MRITVDLHNHSCLSPCAEDDFTPALLCIQAMEKGIQALALSDHNSCLNNPAFAEVAAVCGILPLFGIEVNTVEDVHVLVLFERLEDSMEFGSYIDHMLPDIKNDPHLLGNQLIVDADGKVTGTFPKSLISTSGISFEDTIEEGLSRDALVVPAHIDRYANSVLANLGFLPDLPYSAVEMIRPDLDAETWGKTRITGSDAHCFEQVGRRSFSLEVEERSFQGIKEGLRRGLVTLKGQAPTGGSPERTT